MTRWKIKCTAQKSSSQISRETDCKRFELIFSMLDDRRLDLRILFYCCWVLEVP